MNWKAVVQDMLDSGMTQTGVARQVDMSVAWVHAILKGRVSSVSWEAGQALLKARNRCMRRKR